MPRKTSRTTLFDGKEFAFKLHQNREADVEERLAISLPRRRYVDLEATFLIKKPGQRKRRPFVVKRKNVDLRDLWAVYYDMARSYLEERRSDVSILIQKFDAVVRPRPKGKRRVRPYRPAPRTKQKRRKVLARGRKGRKRRTARRRRR